MPLTLREYRRKRDFSRTPEPAGESDEVATIQPLRFVVQKHSASHLHFDFRLQLGNVMKSWAVPKGPSLDPRVKRLAVEVEDHPVSYSDFEGTIPTGEYGAGTVMLWDLGTYTATDSDTDRGGDAIERSNDAMQRGLSTGTITFTLDGERLRGDFTLIRTSRGTSSRPTWILIKRRDAFAEPGSDITAEYATSVATGRTMQEIAREDRRSTGSVDPTTVRGNEQVAARTPRRAVRRTSATTIDATARDAQRSSSRRSRGKADAPAADLIQQIDRIMQSGGDGQLRIARGQTLDVSNLDREFFPQPGYTKGDLMRYYVRMASVILPVMADRPRVLKRSPMGVDGETFFQQNAPEHTPRGVRLISIESDGGRVHERIVGGNLVTLLYTVQLGCISVDPWHSRAQSLDFADYSVLDLDPGPSVPFSRVVEVAQWVKGELDALSLVAAIKTSGSRGLHIVLPLPPRTAYAVASMLAQRVAERVALSHPGSATVERALKARPPGSVYVDHLQNARGKSLAAAYCVRARPTATVSAPLEWAELTTDLDPGRFTLDTMPQRIAAMGDIWHAAMQRRNGVRAVRAAAEGR